MRLVLAYDLAYPWDPSDCRFPDFACACARAAAGGGGLLDQFRPSLPVTGCLPVKNDRALGLGTGQKGSPTFIRPLNCPIVMYFGIGGCK